MYYSNLLNKDLTILLQSIYFETYSECEDFIDEIRKIGHLKSSFLKKVSINNQLYFIILSSMGNLIAKSNFFQSNNDRDMCINEVIELTGKAIICEIFD